jgi:hypothetical protein
MSEDTLLIEVDEPSSSSSIDSNSTKNRPRHPIWDFFEVTDTYERSM